MKQFIVYYIFWSSSYHISILCSFKVLLHLYIDNNSKQYIYHENIILKKIFESSGPQFDEDRRDRSPE